MSAPSASLPATQQQWQLPAFEGIDSLKLVKDAAVAAPQRGQLTVRVRAVSLNFRDLLIAKKQYPANVKAGVVPTSDGAGEVVAVGPEVTEFKVGDRVAAIFTPSFQGGVLRHGVALAGSLGGDLDGMLTQYRTLDATAFVKLPDHLSFEEAATLPCAGVTAWNALVSGQHPLRSDHAVLVQGTGGVSILAAQIALAAGARVIATSSSDEKLKRVQALGVAAKDLINYKSVPEWGKKVKDLTGGLGVDHVVEVGGPGTIQQSVDATRLAGEVAVIGFVGGPSGAGLNPLTVLMGGLSVRGVLVGSREQFRDLLAALENKQVHPIVDKVFSFAQAKEAYQYLESGAHFGKVVIKID